jgi:hypothetical protein
VFDLVIAGDDAPVPVAGRPAMQAVRDEPGVRRKIAMFAEGLAQRQVHDGLHATALCAGRTAIESAYVATCFAWRPDRLRRATRAGANLRNTAHRSPRRQLEFGSAASSRHYHRRAGSLMTFGSDSPSLHYLTQP